MTTLGVRGRENRQAAYAVWHKLMSEAPKTNPPAGVPVPLVMNREPTGITVRALAERFLGDARPRLKKTTLNWYERTLNLLADTFGDRPAASLTPEEIGDWLARTAWGSTTKNHAVGILRVAFRWAERRRLITDDPTRYLTKPPKKSRGAEAVLSAEDHAKLLAAAGPRFQHVLVVLHATGCRPSEAAAITAENFDPAAGCVRLAQHKTAHHGKPRIIYLTPALVALLAERRKENPTGPLLRNARGNPWKKDSIVLAFRRLRARTGVRATAYHYRHTAATDLLAAGVPEAHAAELLGHSGTAVLNRVYSHLTTRARVLRDSLEKVRGHVGRLTATPAA